MGILVRLGLICRYIRNEWGYPRRWSMLCLCMMPAVIIDGLGALVPIQSENVRLVDGTYGTFTVQVRLVIGVTLLLCSFLAIFFPRIFLCCGVCMMSAQRIFQTVYYYPMFTLTALAVWGGIFVASLIQTYLQNKMIDEAETAQAVMAAAIREHRDRRRDIL